MYQTVAAAYALPANIKKVDVGGGMIHGDAYDFRDRSGRLILAHTSGPAHGGAKGHRLDASFGNVDVLIPSTTISSGARPMIAARLFPGFSTINCGFCSTTPSRTFNPGTILVRNAAPDHIYLFAVGQRRGRCTSTAPVQCCRPAP